MSMSTPPPYGMPDDSRGRDRISEEGHDNSEPSKESPQLEGEIYATRLPYLASFDTHRRLRRFLDFAHSVPASVMWGPASASHVLHDPTVGLPIKIWIVGTVVDLSANVTGGVLVGRPGPYSATVLRVRLLRTVDSGHMARLICLGRRKPWFDGDIFECGNMNKAVWDNQHMFAGVYDATQYFRAKSLMERLPLSDVVLGDVVLAECYCIRTLEVTGGRAVKPATWRAYNLQRDKRRASALHAHIRLFQVLLMITSTRNVTAAYYTPGAPIRLISVPVQHFNFDDGFEQPLLDGILHGSAHVERHVLKLSSSMADYLVFVATKPMLDRQTRLLRRRYGNLIWDGDLVIFRRSLNKQGFVNMRKGDRQRSNTIAGSIKHDDDRGMMYLKNGTSIRVNISWQQMSSRSQLPTLQTVVTVDAPRPPGTDLFVPHDPFVRPMYLFSTHRGLNGVPGNVIVDGEVTQLIYRPSRSTGDMVLILPAEDHAPPTEGAIQTSYRSVVPPGSLIRT
ncbi:uncharacterized protein TRAVEDRAFT_18356 [Trametes versicolor FP-101664 SS1]|uniref:uncharacterized protein n=1 Tax=Trametes versicolor (strain FP-101664) TaxID=717944 RepID=UPI000462457C|nr:uncharacterized protein TRAVEDRAFT_18356 [Trametes versicolor FP-101664 SS1]EIW61756.1 hypothetical protein TRAVEDRAFT_18356 [Trametes versicolor FP-101664 SS1]